MELERPIKPSDLMHATLSRRPFSHDDWLYEWKVDGFRCLVDKWGDEVAITSRQGKPFNHSFPEIVEASTYTRGRSLNWIKIKNPNYSRPAALGFGHSGE
jgi:ATP-dependent DNA ligase